MRNNHSQTRRLRILVLIVLTTVAVLACRDQSERPRNANVAPATSETPTTPVSGPGDAIVGAAEAPPLLKPNAFDHLRAEHKKQECGLCHKRSREKPNSTAPAFPGHEACDRCHVELLKPGVSTDSKLCVACHTLPIETMPNTKFINFKGQLRQFGIRGTTKDAKGFSHAAHMDASKMPQGTKTPECATCHKVDQAGISASLPSHQECYSCHTHQAGQKLGECKTCHTDTAVALKYARSVGAAYSLYNFKHGSHRPEKVKAGCEKCHQLAQNVPENRSDVVQISTAKGQRHNSSCWSCHVRTKEAVCTKCHLGGAPAFF